jgi:hypothetical protein
METVVLFNRKRLVLRPNHTVSFMSTEQPLLNMSIPLSTDIISTSSFDLILVEISTNSFCPLGSVHLYKCIKRQLTTNRIVPQCISFKVSTIQTGAETYPFTPPIGFLWFHYSKTCWYQHLLGYGEEDLSVFRKLFCQRWCLIVLHPDQLTHRFAPRLSVNSC